ncbi:purine nucleoside transporter PunC [Paraferrimonas sedimenticola]|uniref:Bcr/CflA family efflux transporter n=1 Tax=Paraferrimonas sedimenticola TaxID=375674 RepID=A0AA37VX75_9GAMM|nr:purine nucleoside transporter PunC [Paraferrimonas sedimenticola]GLP95170.1 Bcr/CflA family drug resistance efflux transporter [Paraferrimonas sedimenticola]
MESQISRATMIWFAGLSMLGFIATDMYLPAFDSLRNEFATSETMIGLTLSVFLLGMAVGQLVYGPLSDRFGRIKVLQGGLALTLIASLACAMSPSVEGLLFARFLQALGACSATVIWQAVVIDRHQGATAERVFATVMPLVALSPALAPLLGAFVEEQLGWRWIFVFLVALTCALMLMTHKQSESAPALDRSQNLWQQLATNYPRLLSSTTFSGHTLMFAACSAAFFAFLTGMPFVMHNMGYQPTDIGLSFVPQTMAFLAGGFGCRALLKRFSSAQLLPAFLALFSLAVTAVVAVVFALKPDSIIPVLIPFCLMAVANGALYPLIINRALQPFGDCSATAAGLLNFLQTMLCFGASALVSAQLESFGLNAVAATMGLAMGLAVIGYGITRVRAQAPVQPQIRAEAS